MGIFDNLLGKVTKRDYSASKEGVTDQGNQADADATVIGRHTTDTEAFDNELPSVNRAKRGGKLSTMLGYGAILGGGLFAMYLVNAPKKVEPVAPQKYQISNKLPPLPKMEPPPPPPPEPPPPIPLQAQAPAAAPKPVLPPGESWSDRKMAGAMLLTGASTPSSNNQVTDTNDPSKSGSKSRIVENLDNPIKPLPGVQALNLKPSNYPGASANLLPDRDYLITKGTTLDCALETAIDSTFSGLTTCRLTRDVYSDNGHLVLLDRGSQLVGEYQNSVAANYSQSRLSVLWTRAKTPNGVIISLDSPGIDALGRTGHPGWVDNHFAERFGAAILMSYIEGSINALANKTNQSGGTSINIQAAQRNQTMADEVLKRTIDIPPTLYINQGEHIQIMVARDLDFSSVYGIELKEE